MDRVGKEQGRREENRTQEKINDGQKEEHEQVRAQKRRRKKEKYVCGQRDFWFSII